MPTESGENVSESPETGGECERLLRAAAEEGELAGAGVLWIVPTTAEVDAWSERCAPLVAMGASVLVLAAPEGGDRSALRRIEERAETFARGACIERGRLAAAGVGRGGTLAFLAGCTSTVFGAVVDLGGDVLYPELDAARPTQPLELVLNLDRPLLAMLPEDEGPDGQLELLRRALRDAHKDADVIAVPRGESIAAEWEARGIELAARFLADRL